MMICDADFDELFPAVFRPPRPAPEPAAAPDPAIAGMAAAMLPAATVGGSLWAGMLAHTRPMRALRLGAGA